MSRQISLLLERHIQEMFDVSNSVTTQLSNRSVVENIRDFCNKSLVDYDRHLSDQNFYRRHRKEHT